MPVIVLLISILYYKKTISYERKVAVLPIVVGVAMASYGEMTATAVGSAYTFLCILLGMCSVVPMMMMTMSPLLIDGWGGCYDGWMQRWIDGCKDGYG